MTADQFDALAQLLRLRVGPARDAARLVMVDGMRGADAAAMQGASRTSVSNTVARLRRGLTLAQTAAGADGPQAHQAPA